MKCAVEQDLSRYLAQIERDDAYAEEVDRRTEKLLQPGGDYYPFTDDNFVDAVASISCENPEAFSVIATALAAGEYQFAGKELAELLKKHWAAAAKDQAEIDLDGECTRCWGKGCRQCDPEEPDRFID